MNETFSNELPNIVATPVSAPKPFIAFRRPVAGPSGLLLAIVPANITHVGSYYDKKLEQHILSIHFVNGRFVSVYEDDAADTLEALGLEEFAENWVLDLERDLS